MRRTLEIPLALMLGLALGSRAWAGEGAREAERPPEKEKIPTAESSKRIEETVRILEARGGHVFKRDGRIVEVSLNRNQIIKDEDLNGLRWFPHLTDFSAEMTVIGDR